MKQRHFSILAAMSRFSTTVAFGAGATAISIATNGGVSSATATSYGNADATAHASCTSRAALGGEISLAAISGHR